MLVYLLDNNDKLGYALLLIVIFALLIVVILL